MQGIINTKMLGFTLKWDYDLNLTNPKTIAQVSEMIFTMVQITNIEQVTT